METYTFNQFPSPYHTVHLALFRHVVNSAAIRRRLIEAATMAGEEGEEARRAVQFGFLDASVLASKQHLMTAILTTLLLALPSSPSPSTSSSSSSSAPSSPVVPKTRTHNLHSELLLTLHTNNIISEAIKRFGISDKTTDLIVVRFGHSTQEDVWSKMGSVVNGELVELAQLDAEGIADWKALDKIYKLSELNRLPLTAEEIRQMKIAAVVNTVAVKSVT